MLINSSCMLKNSLPSGRINILINNQTDIKNEINESNLYGPFESLIDSINSFPPPGIHLNTAPSRHMR